MKHPNSVNGTFKLSQSTTRTNTSDIGTIAARFVSMYSQTSITKRDPARKTGKNELESKVSKIQLVPLKNLYSRADKYPFTVLKKGKTAVSKPICNGKFIGLYAPTIDVKRDV
jgi:hypothetical protein